MGEITAVAASAISLNLVRGQEQISVSMLKANAQAQQALANMIIQNAHQIETISDNSSGGIINIFV